MKATVKKINGKELISVPIKNAKGTLGEKYLEPNSVFIRGDGVICISGNLMQGPLREHLTPEEMAMAKETAVAKDLDELKGLREELRELKNKGLVR